MFTRVDVDYFVLNYVCWC